MEFRIADTFTESLARLTNEEQKAVKMTAFDLQLNSTSPGMHFHRLERAKDNRFWSVRVTDDIRLIVHRTDGSLLLCYVDHHDEAYRWAERRKIETHPTTGAAQLVEIRETVREISVPQHIETDQAVIPKPPLFTNVTDGDLLSYGVPVDWLGLVREANEDTVLELASHLPNEAAEALLNLAVGITPQATQALAGNIDPFEHPDALRRFRVMNSSEELERALEYPWEKWSVFLHPEQRQMVEQDYNGPVRVSGSAGTGKTIVALHRAVYLARTNPDARVLLVTFSEPLANALRSKMRILISNEPRIFERLEIHSITAIGRRLYELNIGKPLVVSPEVTKKFISEAMKETGEQQFSFYVVLKEWQEVVDAWQLHTWEAYKDVVRVGKKRRLNETQRAKIWRVIERVQAKIDAQRMMTEASMFDQLAVCLTTRKQPPFDFTVVDEAQDISIPQLRFLAALGSVRSNSLFFTGDLGQRIFQAPFSWKALGIDIRGRSKTLRINYRTSHQIKTQADRLLSPELADVDGNIEVRKGTVSLFNGPVPIIRILEDIGSEIELVGQWLAERMSEGISPREIGIFVRSLAEMPNACAALDLAGLLYKVLDENMEMEGNCVSISTMHLAKGLEFKAVVVMCCNDEIIPLQERIEAARDDSDLEEVYNTERHLLYVACTRARDHLLVTGVDPASEFLDDLVLEK